MSVGESGTSTDRKDGAVLRPLLAELVKGALIGAGWVLFASPRRVRSVPIGDIAVFYAMAGSVVFGLRFLFSEVSEKGTGWYYLIWSAATSLGFGVAGIPHIHEGSAGSTALILSMIAGALGGIVFGFMYGRIMSFPRARTNRDG